MRKDRRRSLRYECLLNVMYASPTGEIQGNCLTRDIGYGGMCIPSETRLPIRMVLDLDITLGELHAKSKVLARGKVVWSRKNRDPNLPRYNSGIKFLHIYPYDKEAIIKYACQFPLVIQSVQ